MVAKNDAIVLWLEDVRKDDIPLVGGKCANLGELVAKGTRVPPGFAVTAGAFSRFLAETRIGEIIHKTLGNSNGSRDPKQYEEASQEVRKIVESVQMPTDIENEIRRAYQELCQKTGSKSIKVAVRSSATTEDLPDASFAGQQDTFLNVTGEDQLVHYVQMCWSSLYTPRAIFYREEKGFPHEKVLISVGVQKMVDSKSSGVIFTIDPVNGDPSKIVIEATWGLGEALVGGHVRPDRYIVDKGTMQIVHRDVVRKTVEQVPNYETGLTMKHDVPRERQSIACLNDEMVMELAQVAQEIEDHYQKPQDIEFALEEQKDGSEQVYIVQARPETFWSGMKAPSQATRQLSGKTVATQGLPASPGLHAGKAKIVLSLQEAGRLMREKDILVTRMTNPDWVPYMKIAGAIVTDDGGTTCHAAIVSREMGVPCIVGTRNGTKVLQNGAEYTVDAKTGVIYHGLVEEILKPTTTTAPTIPQIIPVTSTKVYVNLSLPELADKVARETQADGVGLLRAEHMMLTVGKHPRLLIEEGGGEKMVDAFAEGVRKVATPFMPRPVIYRCLDFKLWIMVEVPATVFLIDRFLEEGIDGISFGTNDLTMLILGIDRDDASIQEIYDERNLAVLRAMSHVIRTCTQKGVTTSICGQAPSNYPEVVEFLVREGAVSMSVNPDKVIETKQLVAGIEQKLILEGMRKMRQNNGDSGALQPRWPK